MHVNGKVTMPTPEPTPGVARFKVPSKASNERAHAKEGGEFEVEFPKEFSLFLLLIHVLVISK